MVDFNATTQGEKSTQSQLLHDYGDINIPLYSLFTAMLLKVMRHKSAILLEL